MNRRCTCGVRVWFVLDLERAWSFGIACVAFGWFLDGLRCMDMA